MKWDPSPSNILGGGGKLDILIRKLENERKKLEKLKSDPVLAAKLKEKERLKYLKKKESGKSKE